MKNFISVDDVSNVPALIRLARDCKQYPLAYKLLGKNKTLGLIFMNPSLRTRMSTQKAALNLGMDIMVMNFTSDGWALETEDGVIMEGDKSEHIKEAAAVIGQYCDIVGLRSFPGLLDREKDYSEHILKAFIKYSGKPVINLESSTLHPLQSLADMVTIEEYQPHLKPKVVLTWAPHPKALPQSVANSFAQWANKMKFNFVIANPEGYDLHPDFVGKAKVVHEPEEAYKNADFIYAKNWSSYEQYGKILHHDHQWMVDKAKMKLTKSAKFMHCLPVRRNVVVADAVIDSDNSLVIHEANNRVCATQAVLKELLAHFV